jgi:hypothetical protein
MTMIAVGYRGNPRRLSAKLRVREIARRKDLGNPERADRKPLQEIAVFLEKGLTSSDTVRLFRRFSLAGEENRMASAVVEPRKRGLATEIRAGLRPDSMP